MRRSLVVLALLAACLAGTASASVRIVHRGQLVRLSQTNFGPASTVACIVQVQYADDSMWFGPVKRASAGSVSWTFRIPRNATLGPAFWSIRCGPTGHKDGHWVVARALPPA
jgi:hypothetical protein